MLGDDDDAEGWPWWYIGILWFSGVSTVVSCAGCIAYFAYQWWAVRQAGSSKLLLFGSPRPVAAPAMEGETEHLRWRLTEMATTYV